MVVILSVVQYSVSVSLFGSSAASFLFLDCFLKLVEKMRPFDKKTLLDFGALIRKPYPRCCDRRIREFMGYNVGYYIIQATNFHDQP